MSMKDLQRDLKYIDLTCDALAQACFNISQTNDWVAHAALVTLEGMLVDLGERHAELKGIQQAMNNLKEGK